MAEPTPCARCGHARDQHRTCRCTDPNHGRRGCTLTGCPCQGYTTRAQAEVEHTVAAARARLAEAVLIAHQRRDSSSCICGWAELGRSHAGHQVEQLQAEGVLPRG